MAEPTADSTRRNTWRSGADKNTDCMPLQSILRVVQVRNNEILLNFRKNTCDSQTYIA